MQCNKVQEQLDQMIDGDLEQETAGILEDHLGQCTECSAALNAAHALRGALATLPVEGPRPGFYGHAVKRAQQQSAASRSAHQQIGWQIKLGGAIAAAMLLWVVSGPFYKTQDGSNNLDLPVVAIRMEQPSAINLVFSTMEDMQGARVSLQLPPGIELEGYPGRQMLSWKTDLQKGKNVLKLPLLAHAFSNEEIVARLEYGNDSKTFRLRVRVI